MKCSECHKNKYKIVAFEVIKQDYKTTTAAQEVDRYLAQIES